MSRMPQPGEPFNPYGWFDGIFIPNWLYRRSEITGNAKILYARLVRFTAKGGDCRPSQEYLAHDLNTSVRTVRRQLQELETAGLVRVVQRGLNSPNIYVFLWHDWMTDEGVWYPHADEAGADSLADPERTDLTGPDRTWMAGPERPRLAGPLPYEQERSTKRTTRSVRKRPERPGIPNRPPEENLPDEDVPRRRKDPAVSPTPRAGSGAGLAQHFRRTAEKAYTRKQLGPDPFNDRALASKLAQWKREEITGEQIRTMIDLFCTEPLPQGKAPWVSFLAARHRLLEQARRVELEARPAAQRYTTDYIDED